MRILSDRWKEKVKSGMDVQYLKYADITLTDGTVLNLTSANLWANGFSFEDSVSGDSSFDIGSAIINVLNLSINNFDGEYSDYDFEGAEVICYVGLQIEDEDTSELLDSAGEQILDSTGDTIIVHKNTVIEKTRICTATVVEQPEDETVTIDLTCEDNMRKFDRNYSDSKLKYPATRGQIVRDACEVCGVTLQTTSFDRDDYIVQNRPNDEALTFRQVLQWVAQIGCQWMRCDEYGRLCINWYGSVNEEELTVDELGVLKIQDGSNVNLNFSNSDGVLSADNGTLLENDGILRLFATDEKGNISEIETTYGFTPHHTDVVITGVKVTEYSESSSDNPQTYMVGTEGYVLGISGNKLIRVGDGQTIASMIAEKCVGMRFRPFESECPTDVALEAGDSLIIVDRNGKIYTSLLTTTTLKPGSGQKIACNAKSAAKNSSTRYSQATQAFVAARNMVKQEKTEREKALEEFGKRIDSATGVYTTVEPQENGSKIFYLHDKPTLAESKAIWKMTSEAWGVSTDGGQTWNGGMTVDGDTIVRILNAVGVNATWINTGAITVKDANENILFQVDMDTKTVVIDPDVLIIGNMTLSEKLENMDENIASAKNMTFQLSNDMQTITSDADGNIPVFPTVTTTAKVMYGSSDITNDCSYTITKSDSVTGSWDVDTHTYTVTGLSADNGWVDIKTTYLNSLSVTKRFTLSKQKTGKTGDTGKGIKGTPKSQYQVSESGTTAPTGTWSDTVPKTKEGQFLWTKTVTEYTDGTSTTGYSVAYIGKNGANGTNGTDGNGVIGTEVTYQASNNGTTPPTGEWSATPPSAKEGQYIWTRIITKYSKSSPVTAYSVGRIGENGKQLYTWRKYATMPDGSDMTDSPGAEAIYVGIADNKTTETPSNNPNDYVWSRFRGKDGADGISIPGENGKTSYIHTAYANSIDGTVDFSTTDTDRIYIGHYSDFEKTDSTDPAKYTWARMRGEDGPPGRTYYLRANAGVLMMGQDKKITPNPFNVHAYYRDGQGDEATFKTWWIVEYSKDAGKTWTKMAFNSQTSGITINPDNYSLGADGMIRATIYTDSGRTKIADQQTWQVAVDVGMLTQEQIVEILSNDGEFKGLYYLNGHLYISLDALMGNAAILGGSKNGNGYLKIKDKEDTVKGLIDYSGYTAFTSYEENSTRMKYTGICFSDTGINPVSAEKYFSSTADIEYVETAWGIDWTAEELNISATEVSANTGGFSNLAAQNCDLEVINMNVSGPCTFDDENNAPIFRQSMKVYGFGFTTSGWNAWISNNDYRLRAYGSSSERYKILGDSLTEEFIESLYNIEPIMARYKDGYLEEHDERVGVEFPMFRAEDVDKYFPLAVDHNTDGLPENWNERIMIPAMFAMIKSQKEQLDRQEKLINQLYEKLKIEKEN